MKLDDNMCHMIPHHQVAVDMSKKLLKNTNNDFMIFSFNTPSTREVLLKQLKYNNIKSNFLFNLIKLK